jgi:hypothetical protein
MRSTDRGPSGVGPSVNRQQGDGLARAARSVIIASALVAVASAAGNAGAGDGLAGQLAMPQTPALTSLPKAVGVNTWTPLGPDGGYVIQFGVDPHDHQVVYAATMNGAFKTMDRGANWTRIFPDTILGVAPHPTLPNTVFLANRSRQVYKSTDGGATWSASGTGIAPVTTNYLMASFLFWPGDVNTLFFSRYDSLFKSTDGGGTWTALNTTAPLAGKSLGELLVDPVDPAHPLYVRVGSDGIFKSMDGGVTWVTANTGLPVTSGGKIYASSFALVPGTPSTLLVLMNSGVVYASTDSGATWAARSGVNRSLGALVVGVGGTTVYSRGTDNGGASPSGKAAVWVSTDLGVTWHLLVTSYKLNALAIDPAEPTFLFASMAEGVYVSADAGLTWSPASTGLRAVDFGWGVAFQPGTPTTWYAQGDVSGVFKTTDGGATFANITANLVSPNNGMMAVDPNNASVVYSAGQASTAWDPDFFYRFTKSTDGGATWNQVASLDPESWWALQPWGLLALPTVPTTVYVGAPDEGVFKSTDGGETFVRSSIGLPDGTTSPSNLWLLDLVSVDTAGSALYVATNPGVYKSSDQAATWTLASTGLPGPMPQVREIVVHPTDPDILYCAAIAGVFKTIDGGGLWMPVRTGWPVQPDGVTPQAAFTIAIDPVDPNVLYSTTIINSAAKLYTSRDAGGSWWPLNDDTGLDVVAVWRLDIDPADHTHLIASARGGLYETKLDLRRLTVATTGSGTGTVTSTPGGIVCGITCFSDFAVGAPVTLVPTAVAGSLFAGWSGACIGVEPCTIAMDDARSVTASFCALPDPFALTAPDNEAVVEKKTVTLRWATSVGATSYDVYFGTTPDPPFYESVSGTELVVDHLRKGDVRFWKVVATNACGGIGTLPPGTRWFQVRGKKGGA